MNYTYRERRYYCGNYLEIDVYPVFPSARSRQKKKNPTSQVQQKLNEHNAEAKLIRILNANFTSDDVEIHLTFANDNLPENDEEAARDIQNYFRRVKRLRNKRGLPELKYVCVTEGGSEGKRYHYHVTMSGGLDRDELEKLWGYGYANSRRLQYSENGLEGLARYVTKQFREKKEKNETVFRKRWTASKNLVNPPPKDRDGRLSNKKVKEIATREIPDGIEFEKLYPDYSFASCRPFHNDVNGGYYLCVRMYKNTSALDNRKRKQNRRRQ